MGRRNPGRIREKVETHIFRFMNWKLTYKMFFIYIVAVLVPTSILALGFWNANMNGLQKAYYETQVHTIFAARENLSINLNQIAASSNYYQRSDAVLELLLEQNLQVSDSLFRYIKDILPLNKAAMLNTYVKRIGLYGYQNYSLNMDFGLANISHLNKSEDFLQEVKASGGKWKMEIDNSGPMLCYYCYIYSSTYPYDRGIMVVEANLEKLAENFYQQLGKPFYLHMEDGDRLKYGESGFEILEEDAYLENENTYKILMENFPEIIVPLLPMESREGQIELILFIMAVMVFVFTALYIMTNYSITARLSRFAEHIRKIDAQAPVIFEGNRYQDEVGLAISAYNEFAERTNYLINENLRVQLQKKESDYYALQAQIQPHFLYNILENIRMVAEANHDLETADMLLALGRYMRYTLNRSAQPIPLEKELGFAKNFLVIHRMRNDNIRFRIQISTEIDKVFCPRFVLQPLLENALKHGYCLNEKLDIDIQVQDAEKEGNQQVQVIVKDNGNGMSADILFMLRDKLKAKEVKEAEHIGQLNVNSRLTAFCLPEEGGLSIDSRLGKGTCVSFFLPRREGAKYENFNSGG